MVRRPLIRRDEPWIIRFHYYLWSRIAAILLCLMYFFDAAMRHLGARHVFRVAWLAIHFAAVIFPPVATKNEAERDKQAEDEAC